MAANPSEPAPGTISAWCAQHLGSTPVHSFITPGRPSQSWGFELADGRVVSVKVRSASDRLDACVEAHRLAHAAGIDCPAPLAGPEPFSDDPSLVLVAETWRTDGASWPAEDPAGSYGRLLARLVTAFASVQPTRLAPPPPWLRYDHVEAGRLWPAPESDLLDPERVTHELPPGLIRFAEVARERLLATPLPEVAGHADLNGGHVRWLEGAGGRPEPIVHGWESLAGRPEAVLAGCLAADHYALPDEPRIASVAQGRQVLAAYQAARQRDFRPEELQVAWAAGVWVAAYTAAFEHLAGAPGQVTHQLMTDAAVRLRLAGC